MTEISSWIIRLVGAALISSAALTLAPEGGAKRAVRFAAGLISAAALLSIGVKFDYDAFSRYLTQYRDAAESVAGEGSERASEETRFVIEERCGEYILGKASELGEEGLSASVTVSWASEGYWYPTAVRLSGRASGKGKAALAAWIESELGIPKERQTWVGDDGA